MTGNQTMDYYVRPRHLYSHSRTCTIEDCVEDLLDWWNFIYATSLIVPVFMRFQLSWLDPVYVRHFQPMEILIQFISSAIMEIMVLMYIVYLHHGDSDLCILYVAMTTYVLSCCMPIHGHCTLMYPGLLYVLADYMQSCIMVLCWLGGWSSIWVPSSLHF